MKPEGKGEGKALSRREFLKKSALGAAGVVAGASLGPTIASARAEADQDRLLWR